MELKTIALQLGLPETADEAAVMAKIAEMKKSETEVATLKAEKAQLELASVNTLVDGAIGEKKIDAEAKDLYVTLGKEIGTEKLKKLLDSMTPKLKLSQIIGHQGGQPTGGNGGFKKLSEVPPSQLLTLKEENPDEYKRLYNAEYGMDMPE